MTTTKYAWKNLPATELNRDVSLRDAWNRLNTLRCNVSFLDAEPVSNALNVFGTGNERLLVATGTAGIVAMVLAAPAGRFRWMTFQPSQMPLGAWVAEPSITPEALGASLNKGGLGICLVFSFTQTDPRFAQRSTDSATTRGTDHIETGWVDIAGSFEDYWNARGKNLRQNMRKQRNKLETEGIKGQMRKITDPAAMAGVIERYGALESAGWKAASGTAIHPDNAQGRFYIELMSERAAKGEAIAYEYYFNDRCVAINLCVGRDKVITILKTTYDESTHPFSPAFLLLQDILEEMHAEARWSRVEFYGRMMEWHTRWTEQKRTIYHLTCYRWPFIKTLAERRQEQQAEKAEAAPAEASTTT